jgi:hypothetical protein
MTDYATLSSVKAALGSSETTDDSLLAALITQASRVIDRHCAGFADSDNYFVRITVTDEVSPALVSADGKLYCWPRKPKVESVSALAYRFDPREAWQSVAAAYAVVDGYTVSADVSERRGKAQVKISYIGGFNTLPDDLVNAAVLLAVRFYKEIKSGLTDSIGVAELGTLQYTKALPARVVEMMRPYKRMVVV